MEAKAKNPYQIHTRERWWLKGVSFDVAASLREFQEPSPEYIPDTDTEPVFKPMFPPVENWIDFLEFEDGEADAAAAPDAE